MKDQGETGEALTQRDGEVSERVDREVFSHGGGRDRRLPVQGKVEGGEPYRQVS